MNGRKKLFLVLAFAGLGLALLGLSFWTRPADLTASVMLENATGAGKNFDVPLADTVEERAAFIKEFIARYKKYRYDLRTVYEKYFDLIGFNGIVASLATVSPMCHDEGHDLGKTLFSRADDIGEALRICNDACASGCMHGVLMEAFDELQTDGAGGDHITLPEVAEKMRDVCEEGIFDNALYKAGDCAHGIGHAVMFLANYDVTLAMTYCDQFDTYPMRYYCATGAYMEYVTQRDDDDIVTGRTEYYPCDTSAYPAACFRYKLPHTFARHYALKGNLKEVADACELMTDDTHKWGCYHGIGNAHMGAIARGKITLADACKYGDATDRLVCVDGAMERLAKFYPDLGLSPCNTVSGAEKDMCVAAVGRAMYSLEKSFAFYLR
jgi:hypothetical protein